jgi:hypothetical protein
MATNDSAAAAREWHEDRLGPGDFVMRYASRRPAPRVRQGYGPAGTGWSTGIGETESRTEHGVALGRRRPGRRAPRIISRSIVRVRCRGPEIRSAAIGAVLAGPGKPASAVAATRTAGGASRMIRPPGASYEDPSGSWCDTEGNRRIDVLSRRVAAAASSLQESLRRRAKLRQTPGARSAEARPAPAAKARSRTCGRSSDAMYSAA